MKLLQKFKTTPTKVNGVLYKKQFSDNVPFYVVVDDDLNPITEQQKVYNPDIDEYVKTDVEKTYSQNQINHMLRNRHEIEIMTPSLIQQYADEKAALEQALIDAELSGYNRHITELAEAEAAAAEPPVEEPPVEEPPV